MVWIVDRHSGSIRTQPLVASSATPLRFQPCFVTVADGLHILLHGYLEERAELARRLDSELSPQASDCERLGHAWSIWGPGAFERVRGAFACLVVDLRSRFGTAPITLYREPLGRRSLFYALLDDAIGVASDALSLARYLGAANELDEQWLTNHFALTPNLGPHTPFRRVQRVQAGEHIAVSSSGIHRYRADQGIGQHPLGDRDPRDYAERFRWLLERSVRRALGTAPASVGVMLSGGMDSGPVAALAANQCTEGSGSLTAYAWSLPEYPEADETEAIQASAQHIGCRLRLIPGAEEWPLRDPETWPLNPNTPSANPYRRLKHAVYRAASADGQTVLLNGAAGDNLYPHPGYLLSDLWRDAHLGLWFQTLRGIVSREGVGGAWRHPAIRRQGRTLVGRRPRSPDPPDWLTPRAKALWSNAEALEPPQAKGHPRPEQVVATLGEFTANGISDETYFAHHHGLDRVDPYRDWDLIDFMLSLPSYWTYHEGQSKWIAREAMRGWIPETTRRQPRQGRLGSFFRTGYERSWKRLQAILANRDRHDSAFVDADWLQSVLYSEHANDREKLIVWYCAAFELWRKTMQANS